ncbi:MAG: sigma-70 family RNA polymerase sigma factor [Planctomycetota bacterium]
MHSIRARWDQVGVNDVEEARSFELFAENGAFVRRLARSLVRDPHGADDLVQETWIAALAHPPGETSSVRAWLGAVLRNLARKRGRGEQRRARREQLAAACALRPSTDEVVAGLELQTLLARALLGLEEPYRTTVYLRFHEDLPPREIARRLGLSVHTVKSHLARGLERLRAELDARHAGRREEWLGLLVPVLGGEHAARVVLGGLIVQAKLVLAACVVLVVAAYFVLESRKPDTTASEAGSASTASASALLAASEGPTHGTTLASESSVTAAVAPPRTAAGAPSPVVPSAPRLRGRVVDTHGVGVGELVVSSIERVAFESGAAAPWKELARTDSSGAFDAEPLDGTLFLEARGDGWTTVIRSYLWGEKTRTQPVIVVARENPLGGLVLDVTRRPVEGATITLEPDESLRRELGIVLDNTAKKSWTTKSDAEGRFELPDAPRVLGRVVVRSPNHRELAVPIPDHPERDLVFVLQPLEVPHVRVTGVVVDPKGAPVPDSWVVLGSRSQKTDAHGRFEFDATASGQSNRAKRNSTGAWVVEDDRSELRAIHAGYLPAVLPVPELRELELHPPTDPFVLTLGPPPLVIRGRVEDEDGAVVDKATVQLLDPTEFGVLPRGSDDVALEVSMEDLLRGGREAPPIVTDAEGRFELGGLLDKTYDLFVFARPSLRRVRVDSVRAGTQDLVVRLSGSKGLKRVAGRVVTKTGARVAGVPVFAGFKLPSGMPTMAARKTTDSEGWFDFEPMAIEGVGLQVATEDLFLVYWRELSADEALDGLELVVSRRCFVQLDLSDRAELADHAVPLNARGERTQIMEFFDGAIALPDVIRLTNGKSEVVAVEEDTTVIAFFRGEEEVARKSVQVVPREKIVVRP